ncbi:hypothetical protein QMK19_35715 [Streptomyces sp. H10-C2]|uniref:hypothetical protein n=1 Tax=unclassified Streptomyces TaxID=2593676 RepID=UPI0024B8D2A8|nr:MULTISPECIES: hypothetical protein [unclassified Streptomyces]MDJ0346439.1 hypothetical protein [Streptomyces sp. PH10-H1]MDJ0374825.1 hypothetical protein [Streptomyces sp. H10-C2]
MKSDMKFENGTLLRLAEADGQAVATLMPGVGAHRFAVRVEVSATAVTEGCNQLQLGGEVHTEHSSGRVWLGSFTPTAIPLTPGISRTANLSMPLTSAQVLALEERRNGEDLQLCIDFSGSLPQSTGYPFADVQDSIRMAVSEWERQVETVSSGIFFTVAVPLPLVGGKLAEAGQHLRRADQQITAGEYPDAIREARLAISTMREMKIWPRDSTNKRDDQDQADRYGRILDSLDAMAEGYTTLLTTTFNQASGIQHNDGAIASATWVRADAVALTGMAASLMHRLASEIRR